MVVQPNSLYYGDCLNVMADWPDETFDLVYLDPPFNSDAKYNVVFGTAPGSNKPQMMAFDDTWKWNDKAVERYEALSRAAAHPAHKAIVGLHTMLGGCGMLAYLTYMAQRLAEIRRVLKPTGSVYLHCDPTASHYLKVIMDAVFRARNFRNEIAWHYSGWNRKMKSHLDKRHDTVLFYGKTAAATFRTPTRPWTSEEEYITNRRQKVHTDGKGERYVLSDGGGGKRVRRYLRDAMKYGAPLDDVWDIPKINNSDKTEKLSYPTQKPLALLERIIQASSDADGLILDPFCGCGTTVDAANRLGRKWVGIDVSPFALDLIKKRRFKDSRIRVFGFPVNVATAQAMASSQPFEFERWAVNRIPGIAPNEVQVGDGGVDGRGFLFGHPSGESLVLAQVKGGKFSIDQLRAFLSVVEREKAAFGVFITVGKVTSPGAKREAAGAGKVKIGAKTYPKVQLWSIAEHFDDREPSLPALADPYTGKAMQRDILTGQ